MKAVQFYRYGKADELKIDEVRSPYSGKHEVLVQVSAAGLNPKDILVRKGKFRRFTGDNFPLQSGYEFSGIVSDSNESEFFHEGDHVFGMVNGWKGRCCAEYVNVSAKELFYVPKNTSDHEAAGLPLAGQTALQAIRDIGRLKPGRKILINGGSGGVGTLAIQIAKAFGGIVTTTTSHRNIQLCKELGADHVLDYMTDNILASKEKYDLFFDVFGNYNFKTVKHLLANNGVYVTTVPSKEIIKEQVFNPFRSKKAKLVFVKSNSKDLKWLSEHVESGDVKPVVDKIYPMSEVQAAHSHIETKRSRGKVILSIEED